MILCCLLISGCSNTAEADATSIPSDTDRTASAETDADSESSDSEVNAVYFSTPELKNGGRSVLFNDDWKFILSDPNHAESTALDDSSWQSVSLPHDWSISTDFTADGEAESGFLLGETGWYRKTFPFSNDGHKRVTVTFEGVYMNAAVYLNGRKLGSHPYGYTS
ncbi:MAG: beta-galactosidase, partial [Erysipelotrichia bacterium]|nr:beta-galactosidase [Erysipelotrichia bacterium]